MAVDTRCNHARCLADLNNSYLFLEQDSDCKDGLYCYQRNEKESVPGCSGGSSSKSSKYVVRDLFISMLEYTKLTSFFCVGSDFCVKKKYSHSSDTDTKTETKTDHSDDTDKATDKGKHYCTSSNPCGECYGECMYFTLVLLAE